MKKKVLSILLAGLMVCGMSVPAFAGDDVETLTMLTYVDWYGEGMKALETYINENSAELGFKLEVQQIPGGGEGDEMVSARTATGDLPDIINTYAVSRYYNIMGGEGKLLPLDELACTSEYDEGVLTGTEYSWDGTLYGMPFGTGYYQCFFYNRDVLKEAGVEGYPQSWEEFLDACEKIKAIGKTPVYFSAADTWTTQIFALAGMGKDYLNFDMTRDELWDAINTNQVKFADCEGLKDACAKAKQLIEMGYVQETYLSDTYDMAQTALANGECGFNSSAHVIVSEIAAKYPDSVDSIGGNFIPIFDEGENAVVLIAPNMLGVTTASENPELAKKAVDFMCSSKGMEIYAQAQPGIYINKNVEAETVSAFEELAECPFVLPANGKYNAEGLAPYLIDYFIGAKEVEDIVNAMDSDFASGAEAAGDENWVK